MKHGFEVLGRCEFFGEISFGSFQTFKKAHEHYLFVRNSPNLTESERQEVRLVELVERQILVDN